MSKYNINIKAMQLKPNLYSYYSKFQYSKADIEVTNINTYEEIKSLIISDKSKSYRLNSSYYPTNEAQIWASQYEFVNMYNYVTMFGLGNGIFVRELLKRLNEEDKMYIYEPSVDIFNYILSNYDISDIIESKNVFLIVEGINDFMFQSVIRDNLDWTSVSNSYLCIHPQYDIVFIESYKKYLEDLKKAINSISINRNTMIKLGNHMARNSINNIRYYLDALIDLDLKNVLDENIPAIIVSAGPSLSKNLNILKKAKGKSVIIAVDRALKLLLDKDIVPDFVITLDSNKPVQYFYDKDVTIPMFCTTYASEAIMSAHKGKKIFYGAQGYSSYLLYNIGKPASILSVGGSVATGAFSLLIALGFKNIILIGQDLAYNDSKSTHADGLYEDGDDLKDVYAEVEGIDGGKVKTRYDWYLYLGWFQDSINNLPDVNVIDATEGGAKIRGTTVMTLEQAINDFCKDKIDINKLFENKTSIINKDNVEQFIIMVEETISDLNEISEMINQGLSDSKKALEEVQKGNIESTIIEELVSNISGINKAILEFPIYYTIDLDISNNSILDMLDIYKLSGDKTQEHIATFSKAVILYQAIYESILRLKPMFEEVLKFYKLV